MFATRLSASENARFLEQLRFTIVGSQLLSDRAAVTGYRPSVPEATLTVGPPIIKEEGVSYTASGLLATLSAAFITVWSLDWARPSKNGQAASWRLAVVLTLLAAATIVLYILIKRQYTRYLRSTTLEAISALISNAQSFNTAAATASTLIQEVEIVSRGYRISSPLPPASRLDENRTEVRRCTRLRRVLRSSLDTLIVPYAEAFTNIRPMVVESDLDQYFDIYELSRTDIAEAEEALKSPAGNDHEDDSLKSIRIKLHRLHVARKLYLCCLLALDVGAQLEYSSWTAVTGMMNELSEKSASAAASLDKILSEEQDFPTPKTPKQSAPPQHHHQRQAQARKFTALSQGLRGLQAKMHILREESDRTLDSSEDVTDLGSSLLEHYDAIGADLKSLMHDWEEGRAALTANINKNERRVSQISSGPIFSSPTTPVSLDGLTAVGESPSGAFRILNGEDVAPLDAPSSDGEVFEAVALPRPRSTFTREERIARMKEERARQASVRETVDASRYMLKELETVIKMRPRGKTTGRIGTP